MTIKAGVKLEWTHVGASNFVAFAGRHRFHIRRLGTAAKPYRFRLYRDLMACSLPNQGFCKTLREAQKLAERIRAAIEKGE